MFDSKDKTQEGRTKGRLRVMEAHGVDPWGMSPPYLRQLGKIMSTSELFTHPVCLKGKREKRRANNRPQRIIDLYTQANLSVSVGQVPVKHSLCSSICYSLVWKHISSMAWVQLWNESTWVDRLEPSTTVTVLAQLAQTESSKASSVLMGSEPTVTFLQESWLHSSPTKQKQKDTIISTFRLLSPLMFLFFNYALTMWWKWQKKWSKTWEKKYEEFVLRA